MYTCVCVYAQVASSHFVKRCEDDTDGLMYTKMWKETHVHKKTLFLRMRSIYIKRDVHTKLSTARRLSGSVLQCVAVRCSVLQRVAACCSVLQCVVRVFVVDYQVCGGCALRQNTDTNMPKETCIHQKRPINETNWDLRSAMIQMSNRTWIHQMRSVYTKRAPYMYQRRPLYIHKRGLHKKTHKKDLQKRPAEETHKKDLQKRPAEETNNV